MRKRLSNLQKTLADGEALACLTAYDASQAYWAAQSGVDVLLVGDSLGMVVQGHSTTLPVSLDNMVYHTQLVQRGNAQAQHPAYCIADLPFMSDATIESALQAAGRLMKEGGANMVKLEGAQRVVPIIRALAQLGVPVCGHLGLLPQSVEKHGYKVQGKDAVSAQALFDAALALQEAGADMLVLECVPAGLAQKITAALSIPVIGIGSGVHTSGQVLVLHDILGVTLGKAPKFSKNFMFGQGSIQAAIGAYVAQVKARTFPDSSHLVAE
ncbi:3-methyl-2-oxobutanoate hydroxymethyltransferase 2 [Thiosulfatimonas sediminis]|uniref:3-methyl-2-oxobutanoate hydroxymethyltransferase n=1 Tax=Thiosulfatimonas sediminis TaxID=2675054 RepID=A0A6F8PTX0_9GAMM|nr:3-methyl-2-oxobutanoate hydroxymethyltransferase [Thiosulfatimonas sediminis]BBP45477.1 3-methyl-2-oxobutanoate hydroxymethyltransferase 2 [Thiosulfatimonas sediminis]